MSSTNSPPFAVALYLRVDGTLMLARDGSAIEIPLKPEQLLRLGWDCLALAVQQCPALANQVADALDSVMVAAAPAAANLAEGSKCLN